MRKIAIAFLFATLGMVAGIAPRGVDTAAAFTPMNASVAASGCTAGNHLKAIGAAINGAQQASDCTVSAKNVNNTLANWKTCVMPNCHPGGHGVPMGTNQTINNATPSLDGAAMLLTETVYSPTYDTNALWPYTTTGCDTCTSMNTDFWFYVPSSKNVATLEFDAFIFDATRELNLMWGMQYCMNGRGCAGGRNEWEVWNQLSGQWVSTSNRTAPNFGSWNHMQVSDSRVIGDTSCSGTECLHYNSMTLNGNVDAWDLSEPAGSLREGWHSRTGFQFQIDAKPDLQSYDVERISGGSKHVCELNFRTLDSRTRIKSICPKLNPTSG